METTKLTKEEIIKIFEDNADTILEIIKQAIQQNKSGIRQVIKSV